MLRADVGVVRRAWVLGVIALGTVSFGAGCGGSSKDEIEIVAPIPDAPVHNPKPTSPMSKVNVDNEAKYVDKIPGATNR